MLAEFNIVSRSQANNVTKTIIEKFNNGTLQNSLELTVLHTWRRQHTEPLQQVFQEIVQTTTDIQNCIVSFRLKRASSILDKLCRPHNSFKLGALDDIAGCRIIVNSLKDVYKVQTRIEELFRETDTSFMDSIGIKVEKNYINDPPFSGYRSLHLIVKQRYQNIIYRVEVQIRTRIQHLWATAIETASEIYGINYKDPETQHNNIDTDNNRLEFFRLVSCLFAIKEGTPVIKNYPTNLTEINEKIRQIDFANEIRNDFNISHESVLMTFPNLYSNTSNNGLFLLNLNLSEQNTDVESFDFKDIDKAIARYNELESSYGLDSFDELDQIQMLNNIVLVAVNNTEQLQYAYPNYSFQVREFLDEISNPLTSQHDVS